MCASPLLHYILKQNITGEYGKENSTKTYTNT